MKMHAVALCSVRKWTDPFDVTKKGVRVMAYDERLKQPVWVFIGTEALRAMLKVAEKEGL